MAQSYLVSAYINKSHLVGTETHIVREIISEMVVNTPKELIVHLTKLGVPERVSQYMTLFHENFPILQSEEMTISISPIIKSLNEE